MTDDLPKEFDLVVVGTGFTESCIAAAASRIGKTVLHIDRNDFYGGTWASFNLENFISLMQYGNLNDELRNATFKWYIPETLGTQNEAHGFQDDHNESLTQLKVLEQSRRFNLDLSPKILYAGGELVQLLISSNICRYAEFRAVDRVCTFFHSQLLNVPCSRADVFNSKDLSIFEKRILMKVLNDCIIYGEEKHDEDALNNRGKTFQEYLAAQNVTEKIATCIMQAIAMCNDETTFEEGIENTKRFLRSLGRYGNTPFLFPMYGCGEIPQCFCRLCAVFGGIYCLKCPIDDVMLNTDINSILLKLGNGKTIQAKHVVSSHGNLSSKLTESQGRVYGHGVLVNKISRGVFITTIPLGDENFNSGGGGVNIMRLVAGSKDAIILQLSHFSGTCPKDFYIFHITTKSESDDPFKDLEPFIAQIFNGKPNSPNLIFSAFFSITGNQSETNDGGIPIYCTASPFYELDYDKSIKNAKIIFNKMYANEEFLPRAPDPEEIIIEGEDPRALSEVSLPEDLREHLHELEISTASMEIDRNTEKIDEMES